MTTKKRGTIVLSLGGSLIVPDGIDIVFLKKFMALIRKHVRAGKEFIIICGGGRLARNYQGAAADITKLTRDDLDWLGIHATRLNAHLLRTVFRHEAHPQVIKNPLKDPLPKRAGIIIGAGWKPGCSTDYDAVLLAERMGATTMINLSNISYVYDKDPRKHKDAKRILRMSWKDFRKQFGSRWDPGLNSPFDPVASKHAEKLGMRVIIAEGKDLKNVDRILSGKTFKGSVIE
jgi:uridylate kinase